MLMNAAPDFCNVQAGSDYFDEWLTEMAHYGDGPAQPAGSRP